MKQELIYSILVFLYSNWVGLKFISDGCFWKMHQAKIGSFTFTLKKGGRYWGNTQNKKDLKN